MGPLLLLSLSFVAKTSQISLYVAVSGVLILGVFCFPISSFLNELSDDLDVR